MPRNCKIFTRTFDRWRESRKVAIPVFRWQISKDKLHPVIKNVYAFIDFVSKC